MAGYRACQRMRPATRRIPLIGSGLGEILAQIGLREKNLGIFAQKCPVTRAVCDFYYGELAEGEFMATRFACKKCSFSIVLSGGRFLACPRCFSELNVSEVPDRPVRTAADQARDERVERKK